MTNGIMKIYMKYGLTFETETTYEKFKRLANNFKDKDAYIIESKTKEEHETVLNCQYIIAITFKKI